jgi:hypothetical protein
MSRNGTVVGVQQQCSRSVGTIGFAGRANAKKIADESGIPAQSETFPDRRNFRLPRRNLTRD